MKLTIFMMFILMIGLVSAADFTPQGDINLRDVYNIENVLGYDGVNATFDANVTAAYFIGSGTYLTDLNESDVSHNSLAGLQGGSSDSYYHLNSTWYTQVINKAFSWIQGLSSNNDNSLLLNNGTHIGYNATVLNNSIQAIDTATNTSMKTYVDALDTATNTSMKNYVDGTFITLANESNLNVNSSDYWDDVNTFNSTQMNDSSGELNIRVSWFTTLWNSIFGTKTTDDLTEGSTNLYDNQSWNQTHADTLYYDIDNSNSYYNSTTLNNVSQLSNDLSYYNSTTLNNVSQLSNDNNYWNDTYATFNKSYADTLYAGIEWDYNQTIPANTYTDAVNDTQATWVDTLFVRFTELVGLVGNWTLDKPSYYIKTDVDTNITSANTSVVNWADSKFVVNSGGDSLSGQYDFNGGWTSSGLSIINGDIYAQTGYFYNITGLDVTTLKINGSLLPMAGYDNTFDVGSSSLRWKDLYLGGEVYSNGTGDSYFLGNVGIGTTSPDDLLHVYAGNSAVTPHSYSQLNVEDDTHVAISLMSPNTMTQYIMFADPEDDNVGQIAYNHDADTMAFKTNATEAMRIDPDGNVGIGTASPSRKLDISGVEAALAVRDSASGKGWDFQVHAGYAEFGEIGVANDRLVLLNGGNVGIGTTTPENKIHVVSSGVVTNFERTSAYTNNPLTSVLLKHTSSDDMVDGFGSLINFAIEDNASVNNYIANFGAVRDGADTDGALVFRTTYDGTADYERMRIDSSGNVGIGTTSPDELLHINSSTALGAALKIESTATDGSPFVDLTNDARSWFILNNGDIDDKFSIYDATESEHRLVIDSTGKVGIGTDSPGYKLHINTFTGDQVLKLEANNPKLTMVDTSSSAYTNTIWNHNGDLKFLNNANTVSMLIEQGGSVGIGTTSPDFKLQVNGTIAPEVTSLWDIGSSLLRFAKGWFVDLDVSGNATIADLNVTGDFSAKRAYAMVSSNESQIATVANTAYVMNFSHLEDEYLMNLEGAENITFEDDGDYIMAISTIIITDTNNKHFNVWPQIWNGTAWNNVPRSNTRLEIENAGTEAAIPVTFILDIEAGEKARLMFASDDAGSMTVWTAGSGAGADAIPETPSTIMTIFKHSEITL